MRNSKSKFLSFVKKYPLFKNFYYFYNIYIRNYKFLNNGSQFGEEKFIINFFDKKYKGKFVDIGCFHPTRHNNTYAMYKQGWHGLNIDLNPLSIELFNFARTKDINVNAAISDNEEIKKLYFVDELNTQNTLEINHLSFLKNHHNIKEEEISQQEIKTKRLDKILDKYNFNDIDFMNIDVEGHELHVLSSINFFKYRVKFICIEMIGHNDQAKQINEKLSNILNKNDYILEKQIGFNYIFKKNEKLDMTKKINKNLTAEQKLILFEDGTEMPGSSDLNSEKREGSYHCANCGEKLFDSNTKYESGSGWPSFYDSLPNAFETKTDTLLGYERVEYHCKKCGGHHGHIFEDGPNPTGIRYCNNGVCLTFKPEE